MAMTFGKSHGSRRTLIVSEESTVSSVFSLRFQCKQCDPWSKERLMITACCKLCPMFSDATEKASAEVCFSVPSTFVSTASVTCCSKLLAIWHSKDS